MGAKIKDDPGGASQTLLTDATKAKLNLIHTVGLDQESRTFLPYTLHTSEWEFAIILHVRKLPLNGHQ